LIRQKINNILFFFCKAPPIYDTMNEQRNSKRIIECLYKFYGSPGNFWLNKDKNNQFFLLKFIQGERIQLFYEDVDLYFPFDIYKFNKIE